MDYTQVIGFAAAALITAANFPQVYKIIKEKSTRSISVMTYLMLIAGGLLWVIYGIIREDLPVMAANGISALTSGIILALKFTSKKHIEEIGEKVLPGNTAEEDGKRGI